CATAKLHHNHPPRRHARLQLGQRARDGARPRVATTVVEVELVSGVVARRPWRLVFQELPRRTLRRRRHRRRRHGRRGHGAHAPRRGLRRRRLNHNTLVVEQRVAHCPARARRQRAPRRQLDDLAEPGVEGPRAGAVRGRRVDRCTKELRREAARRRRRRARERALHQSRLLSQLPPQLLERREGHLLRRAQPPGSCATDHKITRVSTQPARGHARLRGGVEAVGFFKVSVVEARQLGGIAGLVSLEPV
ncbi:unnamed protein product, partial [Pelagomonas calceolata]